MLNFPLLFIKRLLNKIHRFKAKSAYIKFVKLKGGYISRDTRLLIEGSLVLGDNVIIKSEGIDSHIGSHIVVRPNAVLSIGDNTGMSQVSINCRKRISIGANVKIGAGVMIFDSNFHSTDWITRRDWQKDKVDATCAPVVIYDDVFIGARSIVTKGVKIGARSIIAAGSVVVTDIPSDCIAGGNPCKFIKFI